MPIWLTWIKAVHIFSFLSCSPLNFHLLPLYLQTWHLTIFGSAFAVGSLVFLFFLFAYASKAKFVCGIFIHMNIYNVLQQCWSMLPTDRPFEWFSRLIMKNIMHFIIFLFCLQFLQINLAASSVVEVYERPDLFSPESMKSSFSGWLNNIPSFVHKPEFNRLAVKGNSMSDSIIYSSHMHIDNRQ